MYQVRLMVHILLIRTISVAIFGTKLAFFLVQNPIFYGTEMVRRGVLVSFIFGFQ